MNLRPYGWQRLVHGPSGQAPKGSSGPMKGPTGIYIYVSIYVYSGENGVEALISNGIRWYRVGARRPLIGYRITIVG